MLAHMTSSQDLFQPLGDVEDFLLGNAVRHAVVFVPFHLVALLFESLERLVGQIDRNHRVRGPEGPEDRGIGNVVGFIALQRFN